jgi:hypothetical protein
MLIPLPDLYRRHVTSRRKYAKEYYLFTYNITFNLIIL